MPIADCRSARNRTTAGVVGLLTVLVALLIATPGRAARKDGTVGGTVTDTAGEPLTGIRIALEDTDGASATTMSDKRGRFSIKVAAGDYLLSFEGEGYARFESPVTVEAGARPVVSVQLLDAAAGRRSEAAKLFNAGAGAFEAGDKAAAKASFLAAIEADPTLMEPRRVLADIYLDEGAWAEAARMAETHLAGGAADRQVQLIAYEAYRKLEDVARLGEMRRTLAADPELAPKLAVHAFNEGAVAAQEGDVETARARFKEALDLNNGLAAAHFALATLEYRAERYDQALATLESGLTLEPASLQGRRLGFITHDAKGDVEAAAEAIEAYAEVDSAGAAEILFKRAEVDFRNGESAVAQKALDKVVEFEPQHAGAHHLLGLTYLTSDVELAQEHLRRFLELAPQDPEASGVTEILASLE